MIIVSLHYNQINYSHPKNEINSYYALTSFLSNLKMNENKWTNFYSYEIAINGR